MPIRCGRVLNTCSDSTTSPRRRPLQINRHERASPGERRAPQTAGGQPLDAGVEVRLSPSSTNDGRKSQRATSSVRRSSPLPASTRSRTIRTGLVGAMLYDGRQSRKSPPGDVLLDQLVSVSVESEAAAHSGQSPTGRPYVGQPQASSRAARWLTAACHTQQRSVSQSTSTSMPVQHVMRSLPRQRLGVLGSCCSRPEAEPQFAPACTECADVHGGGAFHPAQGRNCVDEPLWVPPALHPQPAGWRKDPRP